MPIAARSASLRMSSRVVGGTADSVAAGQAGDAAASVASGCTRSAMQAFALLVVEHRISDPNCDAAMLHRHREVLPDPCASAGQQRERDRLLQGFAPIGGGDVTERSVAVIGDKLCAFLQDFG